MSDRDDSEYFDEVIGDELEADDSEPDDDEEDGEPGSVRAVVMSKKDMVALLVLKTTDTRGMMFRVDPRQPAPAMQTYSSPQEAIKWFNRSLITSGKNGWSVVYDGAPLYG